MTNKGYHVSRPLLIHSNKHPPVYSAKMLAWLRQFEVAIATSGRLASSSSLHVGLLALSYVDRHAVGEGDSVGGIQFFQTHLAHADAEPVGDQGAQELAALARFN